ncbi:dihydroxyacetone kinase subunit L [Oscillospiraceae bacterium PP1C4]
MNAAVLKDAMNHISHIMTENKDYLIELDQQNGDGDLGISMSSGYKAVADYLASTQETDLGKLLMKAASVFNEAAPSSLGTITSFGMMGMARVLKGKEEADLCEIAQAMKAGVQKIMDKAGSKQGEKTILDALCPGVDALLSNCEKGNAQAAFQAAVQAAKEGSESTRQMRSVHGRAAYYGDKSIGMLDGGSVVGKLIFEALYEYSCI